MKVLFDDIFLVAGDSGIARYWVSVFKEWSRASLARDYGVEILVLNRSGRLESFGFEMVDFPKVDIGNPYIAEDRWLLSKLCESLSIDVFLSSYYTFPLDTPTLGVVYDFIPERQGFHNDHRSWLERQLAIFASKSFIAISESTKFDLCDLYPWIESERCSVALPGVDHTVFTRRPDSTILDFKKRYKLRDYVVVPGQRGGPNDYKNGHLVVRSVEAQDIRDLDVVFTGGEPIRPEEYEVLRRSGIRTVRVNLSSNDLATCFSGAQAVIYPSLYEGFGLPPLEGLAVGTPVITTLGSSLPESVGDLSLPISGTDTRELGSQVRKAQSREWIERVRIEGPKWARQFEWVKTAESIIRTITKCFENNQLAVDTQTSSLLRMYNEMSRNLQN